MRTAVPIVALACLAGALPALAQTTVLPVGYENTPGGSSFLSPLASTPRTYQLIIHENQLTSLVGMNLTGLTFRNTPTITTAWPAVETTFAEYDIHIAPSVDPSQRNILFAFNATGPVMQVRSGPLVIQPDAFPIGGSPTQPFGPVIEFTTPYPYTGGNILIEIRHTGQVGTTSSRSTEALGTGVASGYGTNFIAHWASGYEATTGTTGGSNFTVMQISFEPGGAVCYANCDGSTVEPVLNVDDFTCFINEFASAQTLPHEQQVTAYATCDGSTIAPALNVDDFTCFINRFAQGCP
jgi:hypothetical protein